MQRLRGHYFLLLCFLLSFPAGIVGLLVNAPAAHAQQGQHVLPAVDATALDGHRVSLPHDLSGTTIVIVGFSKASADATTAWEIPVRAKLAGGNVSFYDVAVLAGMPGFLHSWVLHALRGKVPQIIHDRFLPVFTDEAGWKLACSYDSKAPDAAYVLLVDRSGGVLWRTHEPYSTLKYDEMVSRVRQLIQSH